MSTIRFLSIFYQFGGPTAVILKHPSHGIRRDRVETCVFLHSRSSDIPRPKPMPSLFQAYSKLLPAYSKLFQLIPAYAQPIPSLFQAYSKLPPSLFRAIPCVFQAIPNVFQAIPALLQASPSISMTFAQEIFGSHFLVIFP